MTSVAWSQATIYKKKPCLLTLFLDSFVSSALESWIGKNITHYNHYVNSIVLYLQQCRFTEGVSHKKILRIVLSYTVYMTKCLLIQSVLQKHIERKLLQRQGPDNKINLTDRKVVRVNHQCPQY